MAYGKPIPFSLAYFMIPCLLTAAERIHLLLWMLKRKVNFFSQQHNLFRLKRNNPQYKLKFGTFVANVKGKNRPLWLKYLIVSMWHKHFHCQNKRISQRLKGPQECGDFSVFNKYARDSICALSSLCKFRCAECLKYYVCYDCQFRFRSFG